jgi:hypothetical protein
MFFSETDSSTLDDSAAYDCSNVDRAASDRMLLAAGDIMSLAFCETMLPRLPALVLLLTPGSCVGDHLCQWFGRCLLSRVAKSAMLVSREVIW